MAALVLIILIKYLSLVSPELTCSCVKYLQSYVHAGNDSLQSQVHATIQETKYALVHCLTLVFQITKFMHTKVQCKYQY